MTFTTNTKPLDTALSLGIINANVSSYHKKSNIAQVTVDNNKLIINLEAASIKTQLELSGSCDEPFRKSIFVSSLTFKQLVSTIETATIGLEFDEGGLILHSGKSKFTLPKMLDADDLELDKPMSLDSKMANVKIVPENWKFIKDNQMYALAMSFIHPVYTKVWVDSTDTVIVGDFDNGIFTKSDKGTLGSTCLLSDTIINLFVNLPEGSNLYKVGKDYIIEHKSDSLHYVTQFTPMYEDDEGVDSYEADSILGLMDTSETVCCVLDANALSKFLSQAELLSSSTDDSITLAQNGNELSLTDRNVNCKIEVSGTAMHYSIEFKTQLLKKVISIYNDSKIALSPIIQDDIASGIIVWTDELITVLSGVD